MSTTAKWRRSETLLLPCLSPLPPELLPPPLSLSAPLCLPRLHSWSSAACPAQSLPAPLDGKTRHAVRNLRVCRPELWGRWTPTWSRRWRSNATTSRNRGAQSIGVECSRSEQSRIWRWTNMAGECSVSKRPIHSADASLRSWIFGCAAYLHRLQILTRLVSAVRPIKDGLRQRSTTRCR